MLPIATRGLLFFLLHIALAIAVAHYNQCSNNRGTGIPPLLLSVPDTVRFPGSTRRGGGQFFVPGTAGVRVFSFFPTSS